MKCEIGEFVKQNIVKYLGNYEFWKLKVIDNIFNDSEILNFVLQVFESSKCIILNNDEKS